MPSIPRQRRRVLIVEDAILVAETLELILSSHGHISKIAHSAEAALAILSDWIPEVALLDLVLPGMNGIELSKIVSANHPGCQIVIVSGHPGAAQLLESAMSEGHSYVVLPKPLDPSIILAIVEGRYAAD